MPQLQAARLTPLPPPRVTVAGQQLTIYVESPDMIRALLEDVRTARSRVWLETYIFFDDPAGRAVAEALIEKAREGLDVRVHYDTIGSLSTPSSLFLRMEDAGVKVHAYHSFAEALWRFRFLRVLNRRNHRKLVVIDDRVAYFGGMNIVDVSSEYRAEKAEHLFWSPGWRDVHLRMEGDRQPELAESFERSWKIAKGEKVARRSKEYRAAALSGAEESIQFFDCGPGKRFTRASRIFLQLIEGARRSLLFSMAYFVPVAGLLKALLRAHRRGVHVRAVIPGNSDVPLVQRATRHLYGLLLRRRFHIYERQKNMLHSKVMVADDDWTVVGSSNLSARSLWINLEFMAVIRSRELARVMREIVKFEIERSRRVLVRDYRNRTCWQRFLDRLAWSLRWWL